MRRAAKREPQAGVPRPLWDRAASAASRLLMLDYDGTLAPYRTRRDEAVPPPEILRLLARIGASPSTRLAIVSGRPMVELERLLAGVTARLIGEHGWEVRRRDGRVVSHPLSPACAAALRRAAGAARDLGYGERLEIKRTALMLHTRGLPPAEARAIEQEIRRVWSPETAAGSLRPESVEGGVELRALGRDKGTAVRELLADSPPGTLPVYLGDDETDEDAFEMVRSSGYGLLVSPEPRPTSASGWIRSPEEMPRFLERWLSLPGPASREQGPRPDEGS